MINRIKGPEITFIFYFENSPLDHEVKEFE